MANQSILDDGLIIIKQEDRPVMEDDGSMGGSSNDGNEYYDIFISTTGEQEIVMHVKGSKEMEALSDGEEHAFGFNGTKAQTSHAPVAFTCHLCEKSFKKGFNLRRHCRNVHPGNTALALGPFAPTRSVSLKCPLCDDVYGKTYDFHEHLYLVHEIQVLSQNKKFKTETAFMEWKKRVEDRTLAYFVKSRATYSNLGKKLEYFHCHRSGKYRNKYSSVPIERQRRVKLQGSAKINAHCPARMKVAFYKDRSVTVDYCMTHVGHDMERSHLVLVEMESREAANRMKAEEDLSDDVDDVEPPVDGAEDADPAQVAVDSAPVDCDPERKTVDRETKRRTGRVRKRRNINGGELRRRNLLTKNLSVDLRDIIKEFSLDSDVLRSSEKGRILGSWVDEARNAGCVLLYKPKGRISDEYPHLKKEDFMLGIMTTVQAEILKRYGGECVCLDPTHGYGNAYSYEMLSLFVLDGAKHGFPCAFFFSNRNDRPGVETFLRAVKERVGRVSTKVLMTDVVDVFHGAWKSVMGDCGTWLFCTWHLRRAWLKAMETIKDRGKRKLTAKHMYILRTELDEGAFVVAQRDIVGGLLADEGTAEFGRIFEENYTACCRSWAFCYRTGTGFNTSFTNAHLEKLHSIIKRLYLKGKLAKRLDLSIQAMMRYAQEKLFDGLLAAAEEGGAVKADVVATLSDRHEISSTMDADRVLVSSGADPDPDPGQHQHTVQGQSWRVYPPASDEAYDKVKRMALSCACSLVCEYCKACIHMFSCMCVDACMNWTMCKHIHLVCCALNPKTDARHSADLPGHFLIENYDSFDGACLEIEQEEVLGAESEGEMSYGGDLAVLKRQLYEEFDSILQRVDSVEQLELLKETLRGLSPLVGSGEEGAAARRFRVVSEKEAAAEEELPLVDLGEGSVLKSLGPNKQEEEEGEQAITIVIYNPETSALDSQTMVTL